MKAWLIALLVMIAGTLHAESLHLTDLTKPIQLKPNQRTVVINLPANPTTGYHWVLNSNYPAQLINSVKQRYIRSDAKKIGADGVSQWVIKLNRQMTKASIAMELHFAYQRAWELKPAKEQLVRVVSSLK